MEGLLGSGINAPAEQRDLNYSLGKAYNDLGDYARAMTYYDEANRIAFNESPALMNFDREAFSAFFDQQIAFYTKERLEELAEDGLPSKMPLFIVGMIRSGTSLCEQILSCHSQVRAGGETSFWMNHLYEFVNPETKEFNWSLADELGREFLELTTSTLEGKKHITEKNPGNVVLTGALHSIYPNAKFIHLNRDPVDNLLSVWMTPITTGLPFIHNRANLVFGFLQYRRLVRHWQDVLPADRFQTFQYEDLTSNPVSTIESLLRYLGLDVEQACFSPEKSQRVVRTPSMAQVRRPINEDSQAKWKRYEPWLGEFAELLATETA
jgi:tetratricopeptide (TPR) repeat protein